MVVTIPRLDAGEEARAIVTYEVITRTTHPPEESETAALKAPRRPPNDLRRYAYDTLAQLWKEQIDHLHDLGESEPFDILFPEPPGMEAFRERIAQKQEQRSNRGIEGVQNN